MKKRNILITGGTGFIGSNIVKYYINQGDNVYVTGNENEQKLIGIKKIFNLNFTGIDFKKIPKIDICHHQAGLNDTQYFDNSEIIKANVQAPLVLFNELIKKGCNIFIYASSTAIYGNSNAPYYENITKLNPLNPYAKSKLIFEKEITKLSEKLSKVIFVGLRYSNVYGPGESHKGKRAAMICQLAHQIKNDYPIIFEDGNQKRDYIYVKDVVTANILATKSKKSCIINCGSGNSISFNELVEILNELLGENKNPKYIKNPYGNNYQNHTECNLDYAKKMINFVPCYDIRKGILDYIKSNEIFKWRP